MEALLESCEDAVEQLLLRMTAVLPTQRDRLIFLINNYDLILNIIDERVVQDSRIHSIIHELEQKAIGEFVEATMTPHFSPLLSFVSECEPLVQQGHTHLLVRYNVMPIYKADVCLEVPIYNKSIDVHHYIMLMYLILLLCIITTSLSQMNGWPYYFGGQSGNSMGNVYSGNDLAGIYLLCNGIGCPGRG
uniref:Vacuolar protein sorting-associated protein 52 homolog n=1 Tax=Heterorhabditis bacteriophora TaxID=37862 RepID=A0A1I7X4B4_HETBA